MPFSFDKPLVEGLEPDQSYELHHFGDDLHPTPSRGVWRYPRQQLFGWAGFMNAFPRLEEESQLRLLISFRSSDLKGGVDWGSSANRFFFGQPTDIKAGKFDAVRVELG